MDAQSHDLGLAWGGAWVLEGLGKGGEVRHLCGIDCSDEEKKRD